MFIRSKHYDNCIQKVKIEFGTLVGLEKDDEAFITLKELPTMDMLRMKQAAEDGDNAPLELLKELLPEIITDHNFYEDEEGKQKMSNEDIASLVFDSLELTSKIASDYTSASFFYPGTEERRQIASLFAEVFNGRRNEELYREYGGWLP